MTGLSVSISSALTSAFPASRQYGFAGAASHPDMGDFLAEDPGTTPLAVGSHGSVFALICAAKPVLVASALAQLEHTGLSPAEPLVSDGFPFSLRELVAYRVDLPDISAFDFIGTSTAKRLELHRACIRAATTASSLEIAEFRACSMLIILDALLLRRALGGIDEALARLTRERGLTSTFTRRPDQVPSEVGCLLECGKDGHSLPLLHDRTARFLDADWMKFIGAYSSSQDMARFYSGLCKVLGGATLGGYPSPEYLDEMKRDIPTCGETPSYFAGLKSPPLGSGFGSADGIAGQFGLVGTSLGFLDQRTGLGAFAVVRGFSWDETPYVHEWRSFMDALLEHVR